MALGKGMHTALVNGMAATSKKGMLQSRGSCGGIANVEILHQQTKRMDAELPPHQPPIT